MLVGGYVVYSQFFQKEASFDNTSETNSTNSASNKEAEEFTTTTSIIDLFKTKTSIKCDVKTPEGAGTVYIGDKKFYGEFDVKNDETPYKGYVLYDGQTSYIWAAGQSEGIKLTIGAQEFEKTDEQSTVDLSKEQEVSCSPWTVDSSKFIAPANITFTDLTSFILPKN